MREAAASCQARDRAGKMGLQLVAIGRTMSTCLSKNCASQVRASFALKTMPLSDTQPLWQLSEFEAARRQAAAAEQAPLKRQTILPSTLQAELRVLERRRDSADALEVVGACVRLREPALIHLQCEGQVWPITLFPQPMLYHSPRSLLEADRRELSGLRVLDVEASGVRPPGHWMHERIAGAEAYHALPPLLWRLALEGPRADLLHEVSGNAVFRVLRDPSSPDLPTPGALGPTIDRLRRESAPLRHVARWPGMSFERASRLVNALYLTSNLIVSRAHHAAQPGMLKSLLGRFGR